MAGDLDRPTVNAQMASSAIGLHLYHRRGHLRIPEVAESGEMVDDARGRRYFDGFAGTAR